MRRMIACLVGLGLSTMSVPVAAQTFTVNGGSTQTVTVGRDFATEAVGDPWDFSEPTDYMYMLSNGWNGIPTIANGKLTGQVSSTDPASPGLQLQFEGINGALNLVGRNGISFPIDANTYRRLSFRMRRNPETTNILDTFVATWYTDTQRTTSTIGARLALTRGFDSQNNRYPDQSPVAVQANPQYHIYKIDLDGAGWGFNPAWTGTVRGLQLEVGEGSLNQSGLSGSTIEVDWVRITSRGTHTTPLAWSGFRNRVTLTATNGTDTIQIFADDGTNATDFAASSNVIWDYGFLPPGTWTVTATDGASSRSVTVTIDPAPVIHLTEPDASGGRDFASTVIGDAWDLTNRQDVERHGLLNNIANETYAGNGLTAINSANGPFGAPTALDPAVYLVDDSLKPVGTELLIDADTYRHLTFTIDYDREDLKLDSALANFGGVLRVIWRRGNNNGGPLTNTQDFFPYDGLGTTYSVDLRTFSKFGGATCADCHLDSEVPGTDLWQGNMAVLRIDPYETFNTRTFRLANVKLAADDEPSSNGFFTITWNAADASFAPAGRPDAPAAVANATVTLFYDTDTNPASGLVQIQGGIPAANGSFSWHVGGVPAGRYFIYARITDATGNTQARYSTGPVAIVSAIVDTDGDVLTDAFETQFGLDPNDGTGDNGADGDPDGDGLTNAQEQANNTHPRGMFTRFFAEGATAGNLGFKTRIATANPGTTTARVLYRFLKTDGMTASQFVDLGTMTRHTLDVATIAGLANAEFSTICESDQLVVSDRTMEWDNNVYGSHAETSIATTALTWHLAEGSTNGFNLFYLIQNPNAAAATVTITFLRPGGLAPILKSYTVAANSRFNVWVNQEDAALAATDISAVVASTNGVTIIVERAMYLDLPGQTFGAGHESAGVTLASLGWFFAEGATGSFFDLFILLANPNGTDAQVRADYLLPDGTVVTKSYTVLANSRFNIWVDFEHAALADTAVSTTITVTNGVPIIAERAMWFPGPTAAQWAEAHNTPGSTVTGTQWALAEGEVGGVRSLFTYILIANTSGFTGSATVKLMFEDGTTTTRTFPLNPNSRFNVDVGAEFPGAANRRFGAVITSVSTGNGVPQIVVERAMYSDANGVNWAAGTNALAMLLVP